MSSTRLDKTQAESEARRLLWRCLGDDDRERAMTGPELVGLLSQVCILLGGTPGAEGAILDALEAVYKSLGGSLTSAEA